MLNGLIIDGFMAKLKSDQVLIALLGNSGRIYRNRTRATIEKPSVTYTLLWSGVNENYAPITVQFDVWADTYDKVLKIEERLYANLHHDLPIYFGGIKLWSQHESSFDYLEEDQSDNHRGVTFRFTPARLNG